MIIGIEKIFSEKFKDYLFSVIDKARKEFDKCPTAPEDFMRGHRFHDDMRVLNECLSVFAEKGIPMSFIMNDYKSDIGFMLRILTECGRCDYYYANEKDWGY